MSSYVHRYARVADGFGQRVREVPPGAWDRPTPCAGWVARDVVGHLVGWVPGFLSSFAGLDVPAVPAGEVDPVAAWLALDEQLRRWLADPAVAERRCDGPGGTTTVGAAIDQLVTNDVLVHTWDLARATGLDDRLDPDEVDGMVEAMEPFDQQLRASGHYGPRVAVHPTASAQDRLLAFLGRDPAWTWAGGTDG
jgi:uncharacterized protein (TIGR03086 family)